MTYPIAIANIRTGLENDIKEFLLPEDAYVELIDVIPFRGRLEKKNGYRLLGRIVEEIQDEAVGNTASEDFSGTLDETIIAPLSVEISIGAPQSEDFEDDGEGVLVGSASGTGTIDYVTGDITLTTTTFAGASAVTATYSYYPIRPCMGLRTRELDSINQEQLIAFDTDKANSFLNNQNRFQDITFYKSTDVPFSWTGTDLDFFWTTNYQNALFSSNDIAGDHTFVVTGISAAASAVITYTGGDVFENGDQIAVTNVISTGAFVINGLVGTVTAHGAGSVTLNINTSSGFTYGTGGIITSLTRSIDGDGIRWYDGTGWANFSPPISYSVTGTNVQILMGALMIIPYKNTLICLNTQEGTAGTQTAVNYPQRARWSARLQTTYYNNLTPQGSPSAFYDPDAWRESPAGKGGYVDAATQEQIIGASLVNDTLLVDFETSTWQLRATNDPNQPFTWERIDAELGGLSTFAPINLDKGRATISNRGATISNATEVKRIDSKIPDVIYHIRSTTEGIDRVYGIRDFVHELALWTYPDNTQDDVTHKYPNRVLVLNYVDGSYAILRDSFTCFGYYTSFNDVRWIDLPFPWETQNYPWNNFQLSKNAPLLVAGNQQGYVLQFSENASSNEVSLQVISISGQTITSTQHNIDVGSYISLQNRPDAPSPPMQVVSRDANSITVDPDADLSGYGLGSEIINLIEIKVRTKAFNPFWKEGVAARLIHLDYLVDASSTGEFSFSFFVDQNFNQSVQEKNAPATWGRNTEEKVWYRVEPSASGQFVTIVVTYSDAQMRDPSKSQVPWAMHVLMPWFDKKGRNVR